MAGRRSTLRLPALTVGPNRLICTDRVFTPLVQISGIDGQTDGIRLLFQGNLRPEIDRPGLGREAEYRDEWMRDEWSRGGFEGDYRSYSQVNSDASRTKSCKATRSWYKS